MNTEKQENIDYYLLDDSKLEIGDVILTTTSQKLSKIIKTFTHSDYSHAMIYVGGCSCIDSTGNGVQAHNTQRMLFSASEFCKVLRFKESLTNKQLDEIIYFVRSKIGTDYSVPEAIKAGMKTNSNNKEPNKQFCSRLVAQAYKSGGIELVNNCDYSSPEDLNSSDKLYEIINVLKLATEAEIKFATEENTPLKIQEQVHNFIFQKTRKITRLDIQTFEQLNSMLIKFPVFDEPILEVLKESEYLKLWEIDLKSNPWNYDYECFKRCIPNENERKKIGEKRAISEENILTRFKTTLSTLLDAYRHQPLKSIAIQIVLYKQLIELSKQRMDVWINAMK